MPSLPPRLTRPQLVQAAPGGGHQVVQRGGVGGEQAAHAVGHHELVQPSQPARVRARVRGGCEGWVRGGYERVVRGGYERGGLGGRLM